VQKAGTQRTGINISPLADGVLTDGRPFCRTHGDEIIADNPSKKVQVLSNLLQQEYDKLEADVQNRTDIHRSRQKQSLGHHSPTPRIDFVGAVSVP
jgi:hypothetical protein